MKTEKEISARMNDKNDLRGSLLIDESINGYAKNMAAHDLSIEINALKWVIDKKDSPEVAEFKKITGVEGI